MALDFPASPSTGQTFTGPNGVVWQYDGAKWVAGTAAGAYAPIASPAFTGNPTAPTPPTGDADTSIATTAFVAASTAGALANVGRNLIHNSMFNIAQRGTAAVTASGGYPVDRWLLLFNLGTASVQRIAGNDAFRAAVGDEAAEYYVQMNFAGSGTGGAYTQLAHRIERIRRLAGKTVILSFWANANTALKLGAGFYQSFGTGGAGITGPVFVAGQSVNLTTTLTRYSMTFSLPSASGTTFGTNGDDFTQLTLTYSDPAGIGAQTGNISIWGVQLELGSTATPLEKLDPVTQLQQCQRFYQIGNINIYGYSAAATPVSSMLGLPVTMRAPAGSIVIIPSYTTQNNTSSPAISAMSSSALLVYYLSTATGTGNLIGTFTASADL